MMIFSGMQESSKQQKDIYPKNKLTSHLNMERIFLFQELHFPIKKIKSFLLPINFYPSRQQIFLILYGIYAKSPTGRKTIFISSSMTSEEHTSELQSRGHL